MKLKFEGSANAHGPEVTHRHWLLVMSYAFDMIFREYREAMREGWYWVSTPYNTFAVYQEKMDLFMLDRMFCYLYFIIIFANIMQT